MIIKNIFAPKVSGEHSAEEIIFRRGLGDLFSELREAILSIHLGVSDTPRVGGKTPLPGLSQALNRAIGCSLTSLGWSSRRAPGAARPQSTSDWAKTRPSGLSFMGEIGLAVEVQFGNHYQFNADVQRLAEAILEGKIIAGVSIVPSDKLAQYKADRTASFSNAKEKLERWLGIWAASGAILLPSIMIIGVEHDVLLGSAQPKFVVKAPIYDIQKTNNVLTPVDHKEFYGPGEEETEEA